MQPLSLSSPFVWKKESTSDSSEPCCCAWPYIWPPCWAAAAPPPPGIAPYDAPAAPPSAADASAAGAPRSAASLGPGFWGGSFHVDVEAPAGNYSASFYLVDWARWGARTLIKATDLGTGATIAPAALVEDFEDGVYATFRYNASARFRFNQVHSEAGDRGGWAPPPMVSAVFFD